MGSESGTASRTIAGTEKAIGAKVLVAQSVVAYALHRHVCSSKPDRITPVTVVDERRRAAATHEKRRKHA